ncbi:YeaC family protein [Paraglaciecola sp.]|uniref:YeaC family protein n=1 Tax=Paraglaciecola sp. TaxID=1920173 RepID=UPI003EF2013A
MDVSMLLRNMSQPVYEKLLQSVETGKWLDGSPLTEQQKETCMQAVMMYQAKVLNSDQHMTVGGNGEIVHKSRESFKQELQQNSNNNQTIARFKQDDI